MAPPQLCASAPADLCVPACANLHWQLVYIALLLHRGTDVEDVQHKLYQNESAKDTHMHAQSSRS